MEMIKAMKKRLRSRAGESLGEVLISLLISSLALIMLAGVISACKNIITKSETAMSLYVSQINDIAARKSGDESSTVSVEGSTVSVKDSNGIAFKLSKQCDIIDIPVYYYTVKADDGDTGGITNAENGVAAYVAKEEADLS